jgi:hypothetical protein
LSVKVAALIKGVPPLQPPKKRITVRSDIRIIFAYSAKKNIAKIIEEYSTLYPATSSASASGKSNGVRLVSAIIEMKNTIAAGSKGKTYHTVVLWAETISERFSDPERTTMGSIVRLIVTSYEIICAAERSAPKNAYLELLAHPAIIIA